MSRLVLSNGLVIDGTGCGPIAADVLIEDGRVAAVGRVEAKGSRTLDCTGMVVAPGFIDAHSHSDLQTLEGRCEKLLQGVTAEVVGNCGFSPYPLPADRALIHEFANGILCGEGDWGWPGAGAYLDSAKRAVTTVYSLVGHGSLRVAVAGNRMGPLSASELDRMEGLLDDALAEGACGFSTGLMYAPGSSAPLSELERLCRVVARRGKIHTSHIRDYAGGLTEAVDEQLELARRTGVRLQISHFQAVGSRFWGLQHASLHAIEEARSKGIDVAFDCYPYIAGSTVLTQLLPQWTLEGGTGSLLKRLGGSERARIAEETDRGLAQTWADISIAATGSGRLVGRTIEEIGKERGCRPVVAALDILIEEQANVNILEFNQSEPNLRESLSHPLSLVISDGFYVHGRPHPRLYGAFPTLLGDIVRRRHWLSLPEAIRKVTSAPAARFGMVDRGRLAPGYVGDAVVFDPGVVDSPATYEDPARLPVGIRAVIRAGEIVWPASSAAQVPGRTH